MRDESEDAPAGPQADPEEAGGELNAIRQALRMARRDVIVARAEAALQAKVHRKAEAASQHRLELAEAALAAAEAKLLHCQAHLGVLQKDLAAIFESRSWRAVRLAQAGIGRVPSGVRKAALGAGQFGWRILRRLRPAAAVRQAQPAVPAPAALPVRSDEPDSYEAWCEAHAPRPDILKLQRRIAGTMAMQPFFSIIVPLHRTPPDVLEALVRSVLAQTYPRWEIVFTLADAGEGLAAMVAAHVAADARIRVVRLERNHGIAGNSNHALQAARGDWCVLLDHDDLITPDALFEMARAINTQPGARLIYSDKDRIDRSGRHRSEPLLKPGWSPDIMLCANYLTHLCAMPTRLLRDVGGWDPETDGAQDWDIFLRVIGDSDAVHLVPRILYHWRQIETSVAQSGLEAKPYAAQAQLRAVGKHLPHAGWHGAHADFDRGQIRIRWPAPGPGVATLIVIGGTATPEQRLLAEQAGIDLLEAGAGDPSTGLDAAIARAPDGVIVVLDAGFEPAGTEALPELIQPLSNGRIAMVGGQVLDHAGDAVLDFGVFLRDGAAYPAFRGEAWHYSGPAGACPWYRNAVAIAGGAMAFRKSLWEALGGFAQWRSEARPDLGFSLAAYRSGAGRLLLNPFARFRAAEPAVFERQAPASQRWSVPATLASADPFLSVNVEPQPLGAPRLRKPGRDLGRGSPKDDIEAAVRPEAFDISEEEVAASRNHRVSAARPLRRVLWLVPGFDDPFGGGIHAILRAAEHMRAQHGVRQAFCVLTGDRAGAIRVRIERAFPHLAREAEIFAAPAGGAMPDCGAADAAIATSWTAAYALLRLEHAGRKFYFLQDWEPLLHRAGTVSSLIEASYRFGFHAICASPVLAESYRRFGGTADQVPPAVDGAIFHAQGRRRREPGEPFLLLCHARPDVDRDCFDAIMRAAALLKHRHGDAIDIMMLGADWSPEDRGLEAIVSNLGTLPHADAAALYRVADAGLLASATGHPSDLALAWMACGAAVVTNRNPHADWLLRDGENCLRCELTRPGLTDAVERLMTDPVLHDRLIAGGLRTVADGHGDWGAAGEAIHGILGRTLPPTQSW